MEKVIKVFIDTNVFDALHYNFDKNEMILSLKKLTREWCIGLLLSDVVVGEVKRHIERNVTDTRNALRKALKTKLDKNGYESWCTGEQALQILNSCEKYSPMLALLENSFKDEIIKDAVSQFDKFISETNATIIDSSGVEVPIILDDYFNSNPPFEKRKDKKNEFPDAFMMAKIKLYSQQYGSVCVVSNDKAFEAISSEDIKVFKTLQDFLQFVSPYDEWIKPVRLFLEDDNKKEQISTMVREIIFDTNPYVEGVDYDRKGIAGGINYDETEIDEVYNIHFEVSSIASVDDDRLVVLLDCEADIYVSGTFLDEELSTWDPEDERYFYKEYGYANEVHKKEFEGLLMIELDNDKKELIDIKEIQFDITLNQHSRIARRMASEYFITEYLYRKTFDCPNCNHSFKIETLDEEMECVSSTERGMGAENQYSFIDGEYIGECTECKKQYKITGDIWEYPVGVPNMDDLKIELAE